MKKIIIKFLIRLLNHQNYVKLSKEQVNDIIVELAENDKLNKFPEYLDQLADAYKNQFLYSQDVHYKGMIAAYITLRETIVEKKQELRKIRVEGRTADEVGAKSFIKY
jgi:hypothetical protein